ncbi:MAG: GDSL family lipase, partial [Acidobacteria bacterium]
MAARGAPGGLAAAADRRKPSMRRLALAVLALLLAPPALRAQGFALQDGDRVVFYGDSITQDGRYARAAETYVATRFPEWTVTFQNAGVGGDKVTGGWAGAIDVRLDRDVIAHKPTVVTVMLGMNDGNYKAFDQATFDAYAQGYRRIVSRLKEALPGVRLTLIQPSPFDDVTRPPQFPEGYNAVLKRYGAFVQELGKAEGATV